MFSINRVPHPSWKQPPALSSARTSPGRHPPSAHTQTTPRKQGLSFLNQSDTQPSDSHFSPVLLARKGSHRQCARTHCPGERPGSCAGGQKARILGGRAPSTCVSEHPQALKTAAPPALPCPSQVGATPQNQGDESKQRHGRFPRHHGPVQDRTSRISVDLLTPRGAALGCGDVIPPGARVAV